MPRPPEGYLNAAGQQVPGVHDITNAYCPKPALVQWAYGRGKQGLPLYEKGVLDIGTAVHAMAELDLKGRPSREIDAKVHELLREPEHVAKAWLAFNAYCDWRQHLNVQSMAHEVTLVSEAYQYGGTPDCIAYVGGEVGLLDFKTCNKVPKAPYAEQLMVMAAHANLWNEHYPQRPIKECHIVYLPKDGSVPAHHAYADLDPLFAEFRHLLAAFAQKNGTSKPADNRDAEIAQVKAELAASAAKPKRRRTVKPAPKERLKEPLPSEPPLIAALPKPDPAPMSMAELLRSYGHIR